MTNNTPSPAQHEAVLTDDEIVAAIALSANFDESDAAAWRPESLALGRAIETALLSKLRAPVADERCKRCSGPGWYTSHTTGYPESIPCSACNPQGVSVERLAKDPFLAAQLWRKPAKADGSLLERILEHVGEYGESMASSALLSVRSIARRNVETRIAAELASAPVAGERAMGRLIRKTEILAQVAHYADLCCAFLREAGYEGKADALASRIKSVIDFDDQINCRIADERATENHFEDELERAYWEMDARIKGLGQHKGRPQPDRDAFKWAVRGMRPMPPKPFPERICICCNVPRNNCDCEREAPALASAPVADLKDWRIDTSAGGPILVYKNCSVIESEQAEYILRLIAADQASEAVRDAAAERLHALVQEAISWLESGGGRADSLCADLRKALSAQPGAQKGDGDAE